MRKSIAGFGVLLLAAAGCDFEAGRRDRERPVKAAARPESPPGIDLPQAEQKLCTAIVILLDTSSSMLQSVRDRGGAHRPKHEIAREAIERIIDHTAEWKKVHADSSLELGIFQFSSSVSAVLAMGVFDGLKARAALSAIVPSSGTAIGRALEMGFRELHRTGCVRKHILCVTDGDNTSGPSPDRVARVYHRETRGEVAIHFVAFDTGAKKFRFLEDVNGRAVEAADGEQLQAQLTEIYDKRILAEAMPAEKE